MSFQFEVNGLEAVAKSFRQASPKLKGNLRKAVEKTAFGVRDDARANVSAIPQIGARLSHLAAGMKYDPVKELAHDVIETKVYPGGRQDRLIGVIENGSPFSAPKKPLQKAAEANEEDFLTGVRKAIDDALG